MLCQDQGRIIADDLESAQPPASDEAASLPAAPFPDINSGDPQEIWRAYFQENAPDPVEVRRLVRKYNNEDRHEQIVALIQAALLNGQAQPWMYEVLALAMEQEGYPDNEVQRVVMSLVDFGGMDFETMMMSAAYLVSFDRAPAALKLYQQASRILPERPEPYVLGLRIARENESPSDVQWAACGVLRHCWTHDFAEHHEQAEDAALAAERWLREAGDAPGADALRLAVADARHRDIVVRLEWSGHADLDLIVEEPLGSVCSFSSRDTEGGGMLVHDGYGPRPENCYESYVCALGMSGEYRFRVRRAWGQVAGDRALLIITQHQGGEREEETRQVVVLEDNESAVTWSLADGRRTQPRTIARADFLQPFELARPDRPASIQGANPKIDLASAEFAADNSQSNPGWMQPAGAGVIGYQSVIQLIPDGASLSAAAVVSADRRYVRIGVVPVFTTITDVFTFSFINGFGGGAAGGFQGGGQGGGLNAP